jgi:hypothetical protein
MKRLLQIVTAVIVACLAVPPMVAEGVCFMVQPSQQTSIADCCIGMDHTAMHPMSSGGLMAGSIQSNSCTDGCCSVSPQIPPAQTTPDKARMDAAQLSYPRSPAVEALAGVRAAPSSTPPGSSSTPRRILLKTFRI